MARIVKLEIRPNREIAACPFCGCSFPETVIFAKGLTGLCSHAVVCPECQARGAFCHSEKAAIANWNGVVEKTMNA